MSLNTKSSKTYFQGIQTRLSAFVNTGQLGLFANGYWGHPAYKLPPEANLLAVAHYLEALDWQRDFIRIHAILGGKNPHPQAYLVGGMATALNPDFRTSERRLAKADKAVARCQKGSNGRKKAVARRAKAYQQVKRQRLDFHHKTALMLVRENDTIYLEDLQVANMLRNRHLAKSISDAGWGQFRSILEAKAVCAGRQVIAIPAHYTSQDCSGCGERVPKSLSVRTHVCPSCGLVMDRDENAAVNILRAGQARGGLT